MNNDYCSLGNLEVYKLSITISRNAWKLYEDMGWEDRKTMGNQFIRSIDSVGANIAEGYGRFHYLDKIKFYYNSRGSLLESKHWVYLLQKREKISKDEFITLLEKLNDLHKLLNGLIKSAYNAK